MHSVTDRWTDRQMDGQQDDANRQSYCVAVRLAKNWWFLQNWTEVIFCHRTPRN